MKHMLLGLSMVIAVLVMAGCETVKGTATGAATGVGKDIKNTKEALVGTVDEYGNKKPGSVQKTDSWMQKNLW